MSYGIVLCTLGPFYMRGTWLGPIRPDEPYLEGTSRYLGYPVMPAYTFLTTKGPSQRTLFERPILITVLEHHMISSDIKDCNFTLLWSWNTPVMPVLTSGPTTRSPENKGVVKGEYYAGRLCQQHSVSLIY